MKHLPSAVKITAAFLVLFAFMGPNTSSAAEQVSLKAADFSFEPKEIRVKSGVPVSISVENVGAAKHNITILNTEGKKMAEKDIPTKKTVTLDVTFPKPGTYIFYCDMKGHRKAGMEGRFEAAP